MIKTLVTLTIIVVIAAGATWYFLGMPSLETALATATTPAATADAAAPTETGSTAPASPVAP